MTLTKELLQQIHPETAATAAPAQESAAAPLATRERAAGGLLALACGDALANGNEYSPRGSYRITGMDSKSGSLPPGQWSDDTGQALCLADSFLHSGGFDANDQMRRYLALYERGEGWPMGMQTRLMAGATTAQALRKFQSSGEPFSGSTHPLSAGNGGLMRLLPAVLAAFPDRSLTRLWARESTRTTHGAAECLEASELLSLILHRLLEGADKDRAIDLLRDDDQHASDDPHLVVFEATVHYGTHPVSASAHRFERSMINTLESPRIRDIARGGYRHLSRAQIKSKAYVADTLEAALWCFATTDSLSDAVLEAANLGDDCDTVAAVTGQLAGCHYGVSAIPEAWLDVLVDREAIQDRAHRLIKQSPERRRLSTTKGET